MSGLGLRIVKAGYRGITCKQVQEELKGKKNDAQRQAEPKKTREQRHKSVEAEHI